jgi:hypothetical protein
VTGGREELRAARARLLGAFTYGTIFSLGWRVQAVRPGERDRGAHHAQEVAAALGVVHSEAFSGNSRCRKSWKPGVTASSSRLFQ